MKHEFLENSLIIIPFVYRGYRLSDGEKLRFRCLFKRKDGEYPYTQCIEEDNKRAPGPDGKYTVTIDTSKKGIVPGRYNYSIELVLESGTTISLKTPSQSEINIVPAPHKKECECVE